MAKVNLDEWLHYLTESMALSPYPNGMKLHGEGNRQLQNLPFSRDVFLNICRKLYVHASTARAVSRADMSAFHQADIEFDTGKGLNCPAYGKSGIL